MVDREKVFDALRNCITEPKCKNCPWEDCERVGCKRVKVPVTLLLDILNVLKEQPQWISVEDRLPDDSRYVLVSNDEGKYMIAFYHKESGYWHYKYFAYDDDLWDDDEQGPITHWMLLPELPEGVKQE